MSVTEVHGALGLDKLKNRTFQIFKVVLLDIFWTDFEKSTVQNCNLEISLQRKRFIRIFTFSPF